MGQALARHGSARTLGFGRWFRSGSMKAALDRIAGSAGGRATAAAVRFGLGGLFVYAALVKLVRPYDFIEAVFSYGIVDAGVSIAVGLILPWIELAAGLACLMRSTIRSGMMVIGLLLTIFVGGQVSVLVAGRVVDCGCFGQDESVGAATVLRTLVLLLMVLCGLLLQWSADAGAGEVDR